MDQPLSAAGVIELRVEKIAGLFDAFDPFPIPSRDLARGVEDFIVGWARELPQARPALIRIHVPASDARSEAALSLPEAVARHFKARAAHMSGDLRELFRVGRVALLIGICVLLACMLGGRLLAGLIGEGPLARFLTEGLIILGWVANWRPLEIFLYDWWPIVQHRRLYERLAATPVEIKAY